MIPADGLQKMSRTVCMHTFLGGLVVLLVLLSGTGRTGRQAQAAAPAEGIVLVSQLNMRAEPSIHGPRLLQLEKGAR